MKQFVFKKSQFHEQNAQLERVLVGNARVMQLS